MRDEEARHQQRLVALARANEVRQYRARVKRRLKSGELELADVLVGRMRDDDRLARMVAWELVTSARQMGRQRAQQAFFRLQISPARRVQDVPLRTRYALLRELGRLPEGEASAAAGALVAATWNEEMK